MTPDERLAAAREEGRRRLRAGIYCRLSLAVMGDTTKVEDQERISRGLCDQRDWDAAEVYTDNNRSAWQHNRKRPAWDKMLADVKAGKLDAIVVYHGDRLVRQPRDLEDLLDLARGKRIRLASPTGTRDLDNDDDQFILTIEAAAARRESASTSRRMKAGIERRRRAGLVNSGGRGGRTFGFAKDGVTLVLAEAAIVREVFARVLAGESIRALAADLARRGVTTTAGRPMHPTAVRRMIALARYAGLMPDGVSKGAWEPVVPREEWEAANVIAQLRGGRPPAGHNARKYLLSGIARCGACESGMQALTAYTEQRRGRTIQVAATYGCIRPGCRKVYRSLALLDAYVARRVVNRLANPGNPPGRVPEGTGLAAEYRVLTEQRAEAEAAIADHRRGRLPVLLARLDSIDARLGELRALTEGDARTRIRAAHAGITAAEFADEPLAVQRSLVSACYQVTVLPASKRGPGFRTEDVLMSPR